MESSGDLGMKKDECNWTALYVNYSSKIALEIADQILNEAREIGEEVKIIYRKTGLLEYDGYKVESKKPCRLIIVGGDGTLLNALQDETNHDAIIATVAGGRRNFYYDASSIQGRSILKRLLNGAYVEQKVWGLKLEMGRRKHFFFNDAVIASNHMKVIELNVFINGRKLYEVAGDGIIISTSSGSSAYNISCGGPLVDFSHPSILLSPLNSTILWNRPVVLDYLSSVDIEIERNIEYSKVILDGTKVLDPEEKIKIYMYEKPIRFARFERLQTYEKIFRF
ncbi:NAD(+) kinase [Fervidicoccus fontis Kam940]|uniref:NAD kinase n=2 Tax=Fervidicoccus fontis TaxID=683846 RepID=H9ZZF9_FERFK|nr:NAD(+) kinase [Fervidicoccus fontis Kam940]